MLRSRLAIIVVLTLSAALLAAPPTTSPAQADLVAPLEAPTFASTGRYVHTTFKGHLYFGADDGVHGYELWRTDGSPGGTTMVTDFFPAWESSMDVFTTADRLFIVTASGLAYAYDGVGIPERVTGIGRIPLENEEGIMGTVGDRMLLTGPDLSLYSVDPGTTAARRYSTDHRVYEFARNYTFTLDGWAYFPGHEVLPYDPAGTPEGIGIELYRTDGLTTELVKDVRPGTGSSYPRFLKKVGNRLYFAANDDLWVTDGTGDGTVRVDEDVTDWIWGFGYGSLAHGSELYYVPESGHEIRRTDGTPDGTRLVASGIRRDGDHRNLLLLASVGPWVYFMIEDLDRAPSPDADLTRIMRTDGTPGGARTVAVIPGSIFDVSGPAVVGNRLYFGAVSEWGEALWRTDGTQTGTFPVSLGGFDGPGPLGDPVVRAVRKLGDRVLFTSYFRPESGGEPTTQRRYYLVDHTIPDPVRRATVAPRITGRVTPVSRLSVSSGSWTTPLNSFRYQWFHNDRPIPANVGGTSPTVRLDTIGGHRVQTGDRVYAVVTSHGVGSAPTSVLSNVVRVGPYDPTILSGHPRLAGRAVVGRHLRVMRPKLVAKAHSAYWWYADGKLLVNASGRWLKVTPNLVGKRIQVKYGAYRHGFHSRPRWTKKTAPVSPRSRGSRSLPHQWRSRRR